VPFFLGGVVLGFSSQISIFVLHKNNPQPHIRMTFTEEQITQLAPDASSLKAGKDLANDRKWLNFQANDRVLWGEVQGSGKDPYRTQVDLQHIAFKCSCPSRKFPCKHGLGLLFLVARKNNQIPEVADEPAWVSEWLNKRQEKAETKAQKESEEPETLTPEANEKQAKAKEKRQNDRLMKVQAGVAELDLWLRDMVRVGILSLPEKGSQYFEKIAARLVDAQATGLAGMVRAFTKINFYAGDAWQSQVIELAARIHLLIESFNNIENLPPLLQEEIKNRIGWNVNQKELLEDATANIVDDDWLVIGRKTTVEEEITIQRNWLYGCKSKQFALVLNFAYKNTPMETPLLAGVVSKAKLVFFPSNSPFRAIIKHHLESKTYLPQPIVGLNDWEEAQNYLVEILAQNPWADDIPMCVENLRPVMNQGQYFLQDENNALLPIATDFDENKRFNLLAVSGGEPLCMFVLRQKDEVYPLGFVQNTDYQLL
jgi:hypothetical protein